MPRTFRKPRPNFFLMRVLGFISRWLLLRGYFRISRIDLPALDLGRLSSAVNPATAAFIGPNHPEFGFDWIMDKEISTRVAPRVASWASAEIVATAPWFWGRNNLIAHDGGAEATGHSVTWALEGNGVLLHPEGSVHWTADAIHPLFHGIAEMACEAARRANGRPVYIVPIVWKVRYLDDISEGLHEEMDVIERHLGLPESGAVNVAARFRALQHLILDSRMRVFGFNPEWVTGLDFFARQDAFRDWLLEKLESRYTIEASPSIERTIARFKRAIPREHRDDRQKTDEAMRLLGFSRVVYDKSTLTQEQIAESLKRHRATLVRGGLRNTIHNFLPKPHGPRVAHVRVPDPILVDPASASAPPEDRAAYVATLIELARHRMQDALDTIAGPPPTTPVPARFAPASDPASTAVPTV